MKCKVCQDETNYPNGLCANCHNCGLVGICEDGLIFNPATVKYLAVSEKFGPVLSEHLLNVLNKEKPVRDSAYPKTVDIDGMMDPTGRITYVGEAHWVRDDIYQCLARVDSSLCKVEVSLKFK